MTSKSENLSNCGVALDDIENSSLPRRAKIAVDSGSEPITVDSSVNSGSTLTSSTIAWACTVASPIASTTSTTSVPLAAATTTRPASPNLKNPEKVDMPSPWSDDPYDLAERQNRSIS